MLPDIFWRVKLSLVENYCSMVSRCVRMSEFTQATVSGYLDNFHFEIVMNNTTDMNIFYGFWARYVHVSVEYVPCIEFCRSQDMHMFSFIRFSHIIFRIVQFLLYQSCMKIPFTSPNEVWIWTMSFWRLGPESYSFWCTQWLAQYVTHKKCQ